MEDLSGIKDKKTRAKVEAFLKRESKKLSPKEKEEFKRLEKVALNLWRLAIRARARYKCEVPDCGKTKLVNAHHIESYITNRRLRYDLENGICLCPTHHKFGWLSAHKSFCFMTELLGEVRYESFLYLIDHYKDRTVLTKEDLLNVIDKLKPYEGGKKTYERRKKTG
jgi:hypothetical protein